MDSLEEAGYNNYWKILNSKDFGIPQNRERVFIVSIRKDCDTGVFEFPEPYELKLRLKDMLEDEVDEKFYINNSNVNKLLQNISEPTGCQVKNKGQEFVRTTEIAGTLLARDYKGFGNQEMTGVIEPMALDEQNRYIRKDGCVGTLTTDGSSPKHNNRVLQGDLRIRKLTPKECFRLMGFDDEDFSKAEAVNSNTQLYKQAGNSIVVVDVAEELLCMMFDEDGNFFI